MDESETVKMTMEEEGAAPAPLREEPLADPGESQEVEERQSGFLDALLTGGEKSAPEQDVMGLLRRFLIGETFVYTDEVGTEHVFDVTQAKEIVEEHPREVRRFNPVGYGFTAEQIRREYPGFEPEQAVGADLSKPVILLPISGAYLLLDGWHRLYHAVSEGVESLPCYVLTEEEAKRVLVSRTPKGGIET